MNKNIIYNKEHNYLYFKELNNEKVISLFTLKPFNFNKDLISEANILKQYDHLETLLNHKFRKIIRPIQVHSNIVTCVTEENLNDSFEDADGLITNLKNVALTTTLADCQGILLYDSEKEVIGNIHSGWKGTEMRIIAKAVNLMQDFYNCNPKNIKAYINPSILSCCFEVDSNIKNLFESKFTDIDIKSCITKGKIKDNKQKYYIDTVKINTYVLLNLGLKKENIIVSNICSKCSSNIIHSYRDKLDKSGRNIVLICLK